MDIIFFDIHGYFAARFLDAEKRLFVGKFIIFIVIVRGDCQVANGGSLYHVKNTQKKNGKKINNYFEKFWK